MRKQIIFLSLVVLTAALLLTSCQESSLDDLPNVSSDGLFLKSAQEGDSTSILYLGDNDAGTFYFPNNIMFVVEDNEARVVNHVKIVEDFHISDFDAVFRIKGINDKPIIIDVVGGRNVYAPHTENVSAVRLPFTSDNIGSQSLEGNNRFNGLLKAGPYVLAINGTKVFVHDLNSEELNLGEGVYNGDEFDFEVNSQNWKLTFKDNSPIGNLFTLFYANEEFACYTLMR